MIGVQKTVYLNDLWIAKTWDLELSTHTKSVLTL